MELAFILLIGSAGGIFVGMVIGRALWKENYYVVDGEVQDVSYWMGMYRARCNLDHEAHYGKQDELIASTEEAMKRAHELEIKAYALEQQVSSLTSDNIIMANKINSTKEETK